MKGAGESSYIEPLSPGHVRSMTLYTVPLSTGHVRNMN